MLSSSALARSTSSSYTNPVTGIYVADPGVLYYRGEYYLYPTAGLEPVGVFRSEDLVTWEFAGDVMRHRTNGDWDARDIWAPEVFYDNGTFYLYYTGTQDGSDATRRVGYATSTSPTGPFTSGGPLLPPFTIDPHPFRDPRTGERYLFFNGPMPQNNVQRLAGFGQLAGSPEVVTHTTFPWEEIWNEAPWVVERNGTYYTFYSAGCFCNESYSLSYATASAPFGAPWTKAPENPILRSTSTVEGPGHNSVVRGPGGVEPWVVYHGRDRKPGTQVDQRSTRVDRLFWNHDRPFLLPPSTEERSRPDPGTFRDLFNRADGAGLGDAWQLDRADGWAVSSTAGRQQAQTGGVRWAAPRAEPADGYVFDVWLRFAGDSATGRAGAVAWRSGDDVVYAWIDAAGLRFVVEGTIGGVAIEQASTPLPAGTSLSAFHELRVTKNEGLFDFDLDGVRIASRTIPTAGAGLPGIATTDAPVDFDGAVYSIASEDGFDRLATTWGDAPGRPKTGAWSIVGGALRQTDLAAGLKEAFKGPSSEHYEVSVDARLIEAGSAATQQYGVVAAAAANGDVVRASLDVRTSRLMVEASVGGAELPPDASALPDGFEPSAFHTIRVVRDGERFEFLVDNLPVVSRAIPIGPAVAGLFTLDTRAEFDNAAIRRINAPQNLLLDPSFETVQPPTTHPWQVAGAASPSGGAPLYLGEGGRSSGGTIRQHVTGLEPGAEYTLTAWLLAERKSSGIVAVEGATGAASARSKKKRWTEVTVTFRAASSSADVTFGADRGTASIDELFLRKS